MKTKAIEIINVSLVAVTVGMMAAATFIDKQYGMAAAEKAVYHNTIFFLAWLLAAIGLGVSLWSSGKLRRPSIAGMYIAALMILAGAMTTHLWSEEGTVHLTLGETIESPVNMTLDSFEVLYYPGTDTPMDYVSTVIYNEGSGSISMNNILRHKGYRFFQLAYDPDMKGTTLSYSHDPWGTGISYAGYYLLILCFVLYFMDRKSAFRKYLQTISAAAVLLLFPATLSAAPKAFPKEVSAELGEVNVLYNGRITSFRTQANDYVRKVYGKSKVEGFDAVQVMTGWMFYYDSWKDVPMKVKKKDRGTVREDEKTALIHSVASGLAMKMFPYKDTDAAIQWYAPAETLPQDIPDDEWIFMRRVMTMVGESVFMGNDKEAIDVIAKVRKYQAGKLGDSAPSRARIRIEHVYNAIGLPKIPAMAALTLGMILFIVMSLGISIDAMVTIVLNLILLVYLTVIIVLRWIVSGHIPLTNGAEIMTVIAWCSALVPVLWGRRISSLAPVAIILSGFGMLVASLSLSNPQVSSLMPVLNSPLLAVHVGCMMVSYTLFGLAAFNSLAALIRGNDHATSTISRIVLYPATFLLASGTFIGAIWANVSWGSYWAWDPKETWALITVLVYMTGLWHSSNGWLKTDRSFNFFCIFAFLSVLFTYFGVNYILGGMHGYA